MKALGLIQTEALKICVMARLSIADKLQAVELKVVNHLLTAMMFGVADDAHYGKLKDELVNNFDKGSNLYPQNTDELLSFMDVYHTSIKKNHFPILKKSGDWELKFVQDGRK